MEAKTGFPTVLLRNLRNGYILLEKVLLFLNVYNKCDKCRNDILGLGKIHIVTDRRQW